MSIHVLKLLHAATPDAADADLLKRFTTARDEAAFAELVRRHGPAVYRVSRRLAPACPDDAFQATFLVLACRASSVTKAASVGSWLIGVAGRVARQMARRERRSQESVVRSQQDTGGAVFLTPDSRLLTTELSAILDDELTRLPDRYRAPVVLCLVNGRTQEQAAAELGGSVRTLRRRLDRAKALLRLRLERRGVVPAVAVGLVASVGTASAVPAELGRVAVRGVFEFLNGAALSPAAVVAKGVVGSMANVKTTALVATAAAVMISLGIGVAQQAPPASDPPPFKPATALAVPALGPVPLAVDFAFPVAAAPQNRLEASAVHRSSNFVVTAPTAVIARAVAAEAEFQRTQLGKLWLGKEPPPWSQRCEIVVRIGSDKVSGSTTFNFAPDKDKNSACIGAKMNVEGTLMSVLTNTIPHEVTHAVLAYHFGKPLPRWADEGIALLSESREEQASHDERSRVLLNAGRGIRLKVLFPMKEYPKDTVVLYAQGHSVVRFLLTWVQERVKTPPPGGAHAAIVDFLELGSRENTRESWDIAAKTVFGFADVDALQEQWIAWLATPKSRLGGPLMPGTPKTADPALIPPTALPGGDRPQAGIGLGRPGEEVMFVSTRKFELPVAFGRAKNPKGENICLYASRDKGATWQLHGVLALDKFTFTYEAAADGEFWFHVVVTGAGERAALDPADQKPHVKVFVDTIPPEVSLSRSGRGVEWFVDDKHLDAASIKLQCKFPTWTEWRTVTDRPMKATDHYAWVLKPDEAIEVRVLAKDAAGNEGVSKVVTVK